MQIPHSFRPTGENGGRGERDEQKSFLGLHLGKETQATVKQEESDLRGGTPIGYAGGSEIDQ